MIHTLLYNHPEDIAPDLLAQYIAELPEWRREQALRFRGAGGRSLCTLAYRLLQEGLREHYGIADAPHFVEGTYGKPTLLEHPHIHFSLSHCQTGVLCALGNEPVGADIERVRDPLNESLVRHCCSEEEAERVMNAACPQMAFTSLWTRKEALVKLTGEGLRRDLKTLLSPALTEGIGIATYERPELGYAYSIATFSK